MDNKTFIIAVMEDIQDGYGSLIITLKERINSARIKAVLAVNAELVHLYWDIGKLILLQQQEKGWGAKVTEQLSKDLRSEFPDMKGLSDTNLRNMRRFAETYPDLFRQQLAGKNEIRQQAVGELETEADDLLQSAISRIPWGHNVVLMEKLKEQHHRLWYASKSIENGWSRSVLEHQIANGLYERQQTTEKQTNFKKLLPTHQSELAEQAIKDPYIFDFLNLSKEHKEKELEDKLIEHITKFLMELGAGFAFVGRQYHLPVRGDDFYIDLLFYHIHLKCYVVIELKIDKFKPEYAGKLNFYLSAVDDLLKRSDDNPTIGILLCPTKNNVVVEYALRDMTKPIGVSEYQITKNIPKDLIKDLPGIKALQQELEEELKKEL